MKRTALYLLILSVLSISTSIAEIRSTTATAKNLAQPEPANEAQSSEGDSDKDIDWQTIEDKLVARGAMLYTFWPTLRTKPGKTYTEVEVKAASSVGITISHLGGYEEIDYADLPVELQTKFKYDPQEAKDFKAGKPLPYLNSARKRAVQDRISAILNQKHDDEVAEVESKLDARRLANERRTQAKQAWSEAKETLLELEQQFNRTKGNSSVKTRMLQQKKVVAKCLKLYQKAQAEYDAIPSPLLR